MKTWLFKGLAGQTGQGELTQIQQVPEVDAKADVGDNDDNSDIDANDAENHGGNDADIDAVPTAMNVEVAFVAQVYKCPLCGIPSSSQRARASHMTSHLNRNPFLCMTCGRRFRLAVRLMQHTVEHELHAQEPADQPISSDAADVPLEPPAEQSPDQPVAPNAEKVKTTKAPWKTLTKILQRSKERARAKEKGNQPVKVKEVEATTHKKGGQLHWKTREKMRRMKEGLLLANAKKKRKNKNHALKLQQQEQANQAMALAGKPGKLHWKTRAKILRLFKEREGAAVSGMTESRNLVATTELPGTLPQPQPAFAQHKDAGDTEERQEAGKSVMRSLEGELNEANQEQESGPRSRCPESQLAQQEYYPSPANAEPSASELELPGSEGQRVAVDVLASAKEDEKAMWFKCDVCHKVFSERGSLKRHLSAVHLKVSFTCAKCEKSYTRKDRLITHIIKNYH